MIGEAEIEAAAWALRNDRLVGGVAVQRFEDAFARYVGADHGIAVNSGTIALQSALQALGVGHGQHVLVPSATFSATAVAVSLTGAVPLFVDIDPVRMTMDPAEVSRILAADRDLAVGAVVPVHLYGHPAQAAKLHKIAASHGVKVVADCAQAHGARHQGKSVAEWADAAAWSFHPSKNLTVGGDGGMVTTSDPQLADRIRVLRDCGRSLGDRDQIVAKSGTWRLNTVQASIGLAQLRLLEERNLMRRMLARRYDEAFATLPITLPPAASLDDSSVYQSYTIRTPHRDQLRAFLGERGIETGLRYRYAVHNQPIYAQHLRNLLPVTEKWERQCLSLPLWPGMSEQQQERVTWAVDAFVDKHGGAQS